jgi:uncharacterized protein (TIGR00661 family)
MARIVYGVSGEGSGHSIRAREVLLHLERAGHQVKVATYDRGVRNLRERFDVFEIEGLTIASGDNRVSRAKTLTENLRRLPDGFTSARALKRELFEAFEPDCVLTDFEPMTAWLARHADLPLVSIDNQHLVRYVEYPRPEFLANDARVTEAIVRAMIPRPDLAFVTTFWRGPVKNERTLLVPPILRGEVLALEPTPGDHVIVYFTSGFESFLAHLRRITGTRFVVYGQDRDATDGNLEFKRFAGEGFLRDLAACRAVIATAGFTLLTEALHLGKPFLALPMRGQFEQELNAHLLALEGCGMNGREATERTPVEFLGRMPAYAANLAQRPRADNSELFAELDRLLEDDCRGARDRRARRKTQDQ